MFITLSTRCARIMENRPFFRLQIYHCSDNVNKRLKQIKLPVSFHTCATCFELPSNMSTFELLVSNPRDLVGDAEEMHFKRLKFKIFLKRKNHGSYIRWQLRKCCAHMKENNGGCDEIIKCLKQIK